MTNAIATSEVGALAQELHQLIVSRWQELNYKLWFESDKGLTGNDRVRQIGEQLNRIGGLSCMLSVVAALEALYRKSDDESDHDLALCFNSDINWAWNGIGDWQA